MNKYAGKKCFHESHTYVYIIRLYMMMFDFILESRKKKIFTKRIWKIENNFCQQPKKIVKELSLSFIKMRKNGKTIGITSVYNMDVFCDDFLPPHCSHTIMKNNDRPYRKFFSLHSGSGSRLSSDHVCVCVCVMNKVN